MGKAGANTPGVTKGIGYCTHLEYPEVLVVVHTWSTERYWLLYTPGVTSGIGC